MHFGFSDDQLLLQKTVRSFLEGEWTPERIREVWSAPTGRSGDLWSRLAGIGVTGVTVPEDRGGMGLDEIDLVLLLEEAGRAALAEPLVSTVAVAAPLLAGLREGRAGEWLARIAKGDAIVAVDHPVNPFVSDAHVADLLLLCHGDELHALPASEVRITPQPSNDPSCRLSSVEWEPRADSRWVYGEEGRAVQSDALDRGALACAAQQLGVTERLIALAVSHARERRQFGVAIGSFQAIKHALADVAVALEYARPVVYRAAHSVARRRHSRSIDVAMAKAVASDAASRAARVALQVHGAIGYTWEHDLHIWMRRAWSLELAWGSTSWHRERVAAELLDREGHAETFGYSAPGA